MTDPKLTPPPELLQALSHQFHNGESLEATWARAFQAGADQELEACCTALDEINCQKYWSERLRTVRRPKPPSLKEQALAVLESVAVHELYGNATADNRLSADDMRTIRLAIEALPDD
jgi:hypothetical protein